MCRMTFRWAWNQRTEWREKACGRSRPENTRSSRGSRTGWEWKFTEWFPGGWSRQRPSCVPSWSPPRIPGDALVTGSRRLVGPAAYEIADWRASSCARCTPIEGFGRHDGIVRYGLMTWTRHIRSNVPEGLHLSILRVADQRASCASNSSRTRYNRLNSKRLLPIPDRVHTNFRPVG